MYVCEKHLYLQYILCFLCMGMKINKKIKNCPPLQGGEAGPQYLPPDTELLTGKSRRDV